MPAPFQIPTDPGLASGVASAPRVLDGSKLGALTQTGSPVRFGFLVSMVLLSWNGLFSTLASPFVLNQRFDDVQYQLLARNRLHGHYEVGDGAHAVHSEGCHPMWRPGLVWVEEGLARCLGSVRNGAAAASALGTTLLQVAVLCLAWRCYGRKTTLFLLGAFLIPDVGVPFLEFAVGQGPEVWAAAASVAGLAVLVEGQRLRSMPWALAAGTVGGTAEWFRTGNLLLFAVPCAVYGVGYLCRRDARGGRLPAAALLAWVGIAGLAAQAVPSAVNKTVANLWACRPELAGPWITEELPDGSPLASSLLGYTLVPGTVETHLDQCVRSSRGRSTLGFCYERAPEITRAYMQHLQDVVTSGFRGLRERVGTLVLVLFGLQLFCCLAHGREWHTFALAGAPIAHYLGPIVLVAGNEPTQYVLVAYPLFALIATRGVIALADLVTAHRERGDHGSPFAGGGFLAAAVAFLLALMLCLITLRSLAFYEAAITQLRSLQQQAQQEQAAIDSLELDGKRIACRNLSWFVDRDVQTVFLPYATVPELGEYVQALRLDGILIWEHESMAAFRANPYGTPLDFGRALQASGLFGPPRISGAWRWYPVQQMKE